VIAQATPIRIDMNANPCFTLGEPITMPLASCAHVLMRQDPPFDMAYITATHLLEHAGTKVWNHPASVRNAPEKLSPLMFADAMPPTLISQNEMEILAFASQCGEVVAKPLHGFGGRSVFRFKTGDANLRTLIEQINETSGVPWMWQQFLPEVSTGDRRIILIGGEVAAVFGRTPEAGSIRANMRAGGTPVKASITAKQQAICDRLSPMLQAEGLALVGLDVIGDYLTEINVTSPTGLRATQGLYGANLAQNFWNYVQHHDA
jgi:glutathione synthase